MSIIVDNLSSGDIITYSLPLITGNVRPPLPQGSVSVWNLQCKTSSSWPVFNGCFKALVSLVPGENRLELKFFDETVEFVLYYEVPKFVNFVRPIYIKCCDDAGEFQGPGDEDRCVESALKRISLTAKLLQTFTAEKMHEHGFERKTFILESDLDATQHQCHVFTSRLSLAEAQRMSGGDLWMNFARELMSSKQFTEKTNCKWFAFMSFTRYDPPIGQVPKSHSDVLRYTKGHAALGGGGLALYGSGTLHCWAQTVDEVLHRLTDSRKMDRLQFMDDSAYREFYWANYSTGLGAALHELGHTFDLSHTPTGVMARGFDDIHRTFTVCPLRSGSCGDYSHTASPVAYSPKQSPVRKMVPAMNGSPKPCFPLHHSHQWSSESSSIVQIETSFKKIHVHSAQTMVMTNYDGSEVTRTTTRHRDGAETVMEVTTYPDSRVLLREFVKSLASGKSRATISMTACQPQKTNSSCNGVKSRYQAGSPSNQHLSHGVCNGVDDEECRAGSIAQFQEFRYKDGGAHWYRSSAVLLRYHKWFNLPLKDVAKPPTIEGNLIRCASGLRLVELRSVSDGAVFHHWEFLYDRPPCHFVLKLEEIREFAPNVVVDEVGLLVEDDSGNILKKKITLSEL